ncbi:MAG: hypothetical protein ABWZ40_11150 [Caulobacterales bacterium]
MADSQRHFADLISALNTASRQLQKLERAQAEAAAAAAPLLRSLNSIQVAAEEAGLSRLSGLADAGRGAARAIHAVHNSALNLTALQRCMMRMRMIAAGVGINGVPVAESDESLLQVLDALRGGPGVSLADDFEADQPRGIPATDENLTKARDEMIDARAKALEAAKLLPMDALALRVQRLAAIAQDEDERSADLAPLSGVWLGVPVLAAQLERRYGKQIRVDFMGDSIFVERRIVPVLAICVEQIVRLMAERSLERPADRALLKKPATGIITLIAACDNDGLSLSIADDGNGADLPLKEINACIADLGGGVEALSVPDWGGSVTLAIPADHLGAWRMQVWPRTEAPQLLQNAQAVA